jgi:hypothetical protein
MPEATECGGSVWAQDLSAHATKAQGNTLASRGMAWIECWSLKVTIAETKWLGTG